MKPLFCQDRRMDWVFKCQADWCLSNRNWWPSPGLFMLLRWLLAARRLVLAFRRWSFKTCKTMKFHWHKLEVTGKRMKLSVWDLAIFFCHSVQDQLLGSSLCYMQSVFFSEHRKGWKRDDAVSDKINQANEVLSVLGGLRWLHHTENASHLIKHIGILQTVFSSSPAPASNWFCMYLLQGSSCAPV